MIFISENLYKLKELRSVLDEHSIKLLKKQDKILLTNNSKLNIEVNLEEKLKKAYSFYKEDVITDDFMLSIHNMNNWPGQLTKNIVNDEVCDEVRCSYILRQIINLEKRDASLIYFLAYYNGKDTILIKNELKGIINFQKEGYNGCSYDSIFNLSDGRVLSTLDSEEQIILPYRLNAMNKLKEELVKIKKK